MLQLWGKDEILFLTELFPVFISHRLLSGPPETLQSSLGRFLFNCDILLSALAQHHLTDFTVGYLVFLKHPHSLFTARATFTEQTGQLYIVSFSSGGKKLLAQVALISASTCKEGSSCQVEDCKIAD